MLRLFWFPRTSTLLSSVILTVFPNRLIWSKIVLRLCYLTKHMYRKSKKKTKTSKKQKTYNTSWPLLDNEDHLALETLELRCSLVISCSTYYAESPDVVGIWNIRLELRNSLKALQHSMLQSHSVRGIARSFSKLRCCSCRASPVSGSLC